MTSTNYFRTLAIQSRPSSKNPSERNTGVQGLTRAALNGEAQVFENWKALLSLKDMAEKAGILIHIKANTQETSKLLDQIHNSANSQAGQDIQFKADKGEKDICVITHAHCLKNSIRELSSDTILEYIQNLVAQKVAVIDSKMTYAQWNNANASLLDPNEKVKLPKYIQDMIDNDEDWTQQEEAKINTIWEKLMGYDQISNPIQLLWTREYMAVLQAIRFTYYVSSPGIQAELDIMATRALNVNEITSESSMHDVATILPPLFDEMKNGILKKLHYTDFTGDMAIMFWTPESGDTLQEMATKYSKHVEAYFRDIGLQNIMRREEFFILARFWSFLTQEMRDDLDDQRKEWDPKEYQIFESDQELIECCTSSPIF